MGARGQRLEKNHFLNLGVVLGVSASWSFRLLLALDPWILAQNEPLSLFCCVYSNERKIAGVL